MNPKVATIERGDEWTYIHQKAEPGDSFTPSFTRSGSVVDVPTDAAEKKAFALRYPYAPFTPLNSAKVFLYNLVQIWISGSVIQTKADGTLGGKATLSGQVACVYPAEYYNEFPSRTPPMVFPDGAEYVCCMPTEKTLFWERSSCSMSIGEVKTLSVKTQKRHRVLLVSGIIEYQGKQYTGPTTMKITEDKTLKAVSDVLAIEVWI